MNIGFIGAGKVGFTLGKYFKEHGAVITGYYSRSPKSAEEAAAFTGSIFYKTPEQVLAESDMLFLTVPDGEIKAVWEKLRASGTLDIGNKAICHCSGLLPSNIFDGTKNGYSVHPLVAIYSKYDSYKEMSNILFAVEGGGEHLHTIKAFITRMGNPVQTITAEQKSKYHAAAVFLSNHVTALAYTGCRLLEECGFERDIIRTALQTLFLNQCKVIAAQGGESVSLANVLTGSVERNDTATVKKHIECLGESDNGLYKELTKRLIEIAKLKHNDYNYGEMEILFKEATK